MILRCSFVFLLNKIRWLLFLVFTSEVSAQTSDFYDKILVNGHIITVDKNFRIAEAIAIRDGRFIAIGSNKAIQSLADPNVEVIDLKGRTVVPGFIDGHAHMDREGLKFILPSLDGVRSIDDILEVIKQEVKNKKPGEWIVTMPIGDYPNYAGGSDLLKEIWKLFYDEENNMLQKNIYEEIKELFLALSDKNSKGGLYVGKSGSGHYVKMIHNGIEYGMMQSIAEGLDILKNKSDFKFKLEDITENWRSGSVIQSWLLDLIASELKIDPKLNNYNSIVNDSGEGRWTIKESIDLSVPIPSIYSSISQRFNSRQKSSFAGKILSAMRNAFGGHK